MSNIALVKCYRVIQDVHTMNSGEKTFMASRVFFTMQTLPEGPIHDLFVDIGQPHGTDYAEPFECSAPYIHENRSFPRQSTNSVFAFNQYNGKWNLHEFSDHMETYYKNMIGVSGSIISVAGGAQNTVMSGNTIDSPYSFTMNLPD